MRINGDRNVNVRYTCKEDDVNGRAIKWNQLRIDRTNVNRIVTVACRGYKPKLQGEGSGVRGKDKK